MRRLLTLIALLCLVTPASAATVRVLKQSDYDTDDDFGRDDTETITAAAIFRAAPGEANRVSIRRKPGARLVFTDRGAPLQAGRRCHTKSLHRVVCIVTRSVDARTLTVGLGDRDDRAFTSRDIRIDATWYGREGDDHISGTGGTDLVTGGAGDDVLRGADAADALRGGEGDDRVFGGAGRDTLIAGPGRDAVRGGPDADRLFSIDGPRPVRDRFDGGQGVDTIDYSDRRLPVTATLGGSGGVAGERDRLRHLENLLGGLGADVLIGDAGPNRFDGYDGPDVFAGRGGDDRFDVSGDPDRVGCGTGSDRVLATTATAYLVDPDCERVTPGSFGALLANPLATTAERVTLRVPCASPAATAAERVIELRIPFAVSAWYSGGGLGGLVGTGEVPVGTPPDRCDTDVVLNDAGRALVRPVPVRISIGTVAWHVQLR